MTATDANVITIAALYKPAYDEKQQRFIGGGHVCSFTRDTRPTLFARDVERRSRRRRSAGIDVRYVQREKSALAIRRDTSPSFKLRNVSFPPLSRSATDTVNYYVSRLFD